MILLTSAAVALGGCQGIKVTTSIPVDLYVARDEDGFGLIEPLENTGPLLPGESRTLTKLPGDTLRVVAVATDGRYAWGYRSGHDTEPIRISEGYLFGDTAYLDDMLNTRIRTGMPYLAVFMSWGNQHPYNSTRYVAGSSSFEQHQWNSHSGHTYTVLFREGAVQSWYESRR